MRLIDADSVMFTNFEIFMCEGDYKQAFKLLCEKLDDAPTVNAEPVRRGHWVRHNTYHGDDTSGFVDPDWRCSECDKQATVNEWFLYDLTPYCPNCGAKMDGE